MLVRLNLGGSGFIPLLNGNGAGGLRRSGLGDLDELAASIRANGILQPLVVEDVAGDFLIIAGHRRLAAAKRAGLTHVPCLVRPTAEDSRNTARMLVENIQRADLHPLDEARAYEQLLADGWTRQQVAAATGVKLARISARLDLLHLPADAQAMVRTGTLPIGQATGLARQVKATKTGAVHVRPERCPAHFTRAHRLAGPAQRHCDEQEHPTAGRLDGTACGACWEHVIRLHALRGDAS